MSENPPVCRNCAGSEWVCEDHRDLPWHGTSNSSLACSCGGAGSPCPVCSPAMANAGRVEPLIDVLLTLRDYVWDAAMGYIIYPKTAACHVARIDAVIAKARETTNA